MMLQYQRFALFLFCNISGADPGFANVGVNHMEQVNWLEVYYSIAFVISTQQRGATSVLLQNGWCPWGMTLYEL